MPMSTLAPRPDQTAPRQISVWHAMSFFAWLRTVSEHRFRIQPARIPLAGLITLTTLGQSLLGLTERALFGRAVARTVIDPPPVFILGHWRSGTTLLHELLGADPRHTCPTNYQCFCPQHFLLSSCFLKPVLRAITPAQRPQDNMDFDLDLPQEDECALNVLGASATYRGMAFACEPCLRMEEFDVELQEPGLRRRWEAALGRFLQKVYYARPGRLIIKSPPHTFRVPTLLRLFPEARFVYLRRNPYRVFLSTMNLWRSVAQLYSLQAREFRGLENYVLDVFEQMDATFERTRGLIPPGRLHELSFEQVVRDPVETVRALYAQLELGDFSGAAPAVEAYLHSRASYRRNAYTMSPDTIRIINQRWGPIISRWGYDLQPPDAPSGTKA